MPLSPLQLLLSLSACGGGSSVQDFALPEEILTGEQRLVLRTSVDPAESWAGGFEDFSAALNALLSANTVLTRGADQSLEAWRADASHRPEIFSGGDAVEQLLSSSLTTTNTGSPPTAAEFLDSCGNSVYFSWIHPDQWQYEASWYGDWEGDTLVDYVTSSPEWPGICGSDLDCNTFSEGSWALDALSLNTDGGLSATFSLSGAGDAPALWGHYAIELLTDQDGGLGTVVPAVVSAARLSFTLDFAHVSGGDGLDYYAFPASESLDAAAVEVEPFAGCAAYMNGAFPGEELPFGCEAVEETSFPLLLDRSSARGAELFDTVTDEGSDTSLLTQMGPWLGYQLAASMACPPPQDEEPVSSGVIEAVWCSASDITSCFR